MKVYSPSIIEELDVSGSATITGSLDVTGIISASAFSGSVSLSQTASYVELINVDGLATYTSSINSKIGFLEGESGSIRVDFTNYTSSANNRLLSLETESGSIRSAFNTFTGSSGLVSGSAQVDHNSTTNYVANQHIDHSTVSISAGSGIAGGGNITTSRTLTLDTGSTHFTSGVKAKLNTDGVVSSSAQVSYSGLDGIPSGIVSSSGQIDHNSTTNYVANQHIDHSTVNISAGNGITGGGSIAASRTITLDTGSTHFSAGTKTVLNSNTVVSSSAQIVASFPAGTVSSSAQVDHNATTNYVANQHIDHSTVNISAGNGITGGGNITTSRTLTLDTGSTHFTSGVKAKLNTDGVISSSAQIDHNSTTNYVANQHIDHSTVNISAGNGITGGGNITTSRTLALDTGSTHFSAGTKTVLNTNTVVSSSAQIVAGLPTNTVSSSAQIIAGLPANTVSSSAQVDHNATTNYVANQHIDHSTVNISAGNGITGGGSIAASRTLTLDTGSTHFSAGTKTVLNSNTVVSSSAQVDINSTTGTLNVNKGGTGQTSYTNGQLLIGNTTGNTLVKATLTGTTDRILITNGAGSITINADATSANTANKIVARDASGNFAAGAITSSFTQVTATASLASANYTNKVSGSGNYRLVVPVGTDLWAT